MTVKTIEVVQELIEEMQGTRQEVGSAWEFTNAMNGQQMFAVFPASQYCDIYESPGVKNPKQIWANGQYLGEYANLNDQEDFRVFRDFRAIHYT